jgi:tetratricopeptide (TPR) repeat protein
MKNLFQPDLLIRLLVPLLMIPLLGISTRPHMVERFLREGKHGQIYGSYLSASLNLSQAANFYYWRAELWEMAGLLAVKAGDYEAAVRYLDKASGQGSLSPRAQIALGDALFENQDIEAAILIWEKAFESGVDTTEITNRLTKAHLKSRDYPTAADNLKELLAIRPDDPELYYQLGLLMAATQPDSAPAYLTQAAALDTQLTGPAQKLRRSINTARLSQEPAYTYIVAGRTLASLGEWELAVEAFRQATLARPDYSEAWAFLGEARQHLPSASEMDAQILSDLEEALRLDPHSIAANTFLSLYWQRHEKPELALEYLESAALYDPANPAFPAEVGNLLSDMGDLPAAQAAYQDAIDLAPKDPLYWRLMAEFAVRHQIQLRELALPSAEQAVLLNDKDPASLMILGIVYYLLEEFEISEHYLLESLEIDPDFAPAHLHLGMNYLLRGEVGMAAQELEQARALAPETAISEKVDRLLEGYFP